MVKGAIYMRSESMPTLTYQELGELLNAREPFICMFLSPDALTFMRSRSRSSFSFYPIFFSLPQIYYSRRLGLQSSSS